MCENESVENPTKSENWPPRKKYKKSFEKAKSKTPNQIKKRSILNKLKFYHGVTLWRSDRIRFGILTHIGITLNPPFDFKMRQKHLR